MAPPKPVPDQQTNKLQVYLTPVLFRAILLLLLSDTIVSQSIIKTLPGFPSDLPFELETGYIGVGERDEVQLFYYFLESERNPRDDPLILWMAGGPGPLKFNFTLNSSNSGENIPTLELNPYTWTKVANIIFIDQPAGTGFSYAKTLEAYNSSDTRSASLTYDFLRKWLVDHPKFLNNPLYIGGISYIGIVVPIVVQEIYNGNEAGKEPRMKIKGYILFNPLTDKNSDINSRVPYAHRVALLSDQLYESAKSNCHGVYIAVDPDNRLCASDLELVNECVEKIYPDSILEPVCLTTISKPNLLRRYKSSLEENHIDIIPSLPRLSEPWCRDNTYKAAAVWANDKAVQNALHIREGTITEWVRCNQSIRYSIGLSETVCYTFNIPSSVDYHRNLTNKKCRALIASGDHDMVVPHLGTENWIRSLNLTVESGWEPWFVEGQVAGYTKSYIHNDYSLTYATAKGAGHTGPEHKPKEYLAMVDRWFAYFPL